ncbi:hypothetical protein 7S2_45 [uncultured Caudovirales phage]|uniref:Uncharacterized protein n=1 Tax=uncultured Caudovirales phage TaxID=2100421 RepID=A0A2H4JGP0_9CAUD|nr:hypothetical protein 7S2_45 [uncultured Caudovirales phage]
MTKPPPFTGWGPFVVPGTDDPAPGVQPGMDELWDIALWEAEYEQWLIDSGDE